MTAPEVVEIHLTKREQEVAMLVIEGNDSKTVARRLFLSKRTVDYHLARIFEKLQVSNRVQMCRRMSALGLITPEDSSTTGALCVA